MNNKTAVHDDAASNSGITGEFRIDSLLGEIADCAPELSDVVSWRDIGFEILQRDGCDPDYE
ncbi:MAG TPA: hypothetical protein VKV05_00685 [Terriglobales bacterium]|nr:hypothetical protein [Terriglobales bacterium]